MSYSAVGRRYVAYIIAVERQRASRVVAPGSGNCLVPLIVFSAFSRAALVTA